MPSKPSLTAGAFIDSAMLHGAVAAFYRSPTEMTQWECYSLAMTTLGLWFHDGLRIQAGNYEGASAFDSALRELGAVRAEPSKSEDYVECVRRTNEWAMDNVADVRNSLRRMQTDPSYDNWIDWSVKHAWDEHRRRHGGLIDASMAKPVNMILDLSSTQTAEQLIADSQNSTYVRQWVEAGAAKAPQEIVKGYLVSALLRGVVNHELRCREGSQYAFHPFRRVILSAGKASIEYPVPDTARWLASMILNSSFQIRDPRERAVCWAHNVARVRLAIMDPDQPLIFDPSLTDQKAANRAAQIVRELKLPMHSRVIGGGIEVLVIALDYFWVITIVDYIAKLTGWRVSSGALGERLTKTSRHLTDLGAQRPGQVVFRTSQTSPVPTD
jgi:hypothetical protein